MKIHQDDQSDKLIEAKYPGKCMACGKEIRKGDSAYWQPGESGLICVRCHKG